jgi:nitronate monooxygenase
MKKISLHTELCDMLGIQYPIVLAGMGTIAGPSLAGAVSNAGGLGVIGATSIPPEVIRSWIRKTREITDKPFAVDIVMPEAVLVGGTEEELRSQIPQQHIDYVEQLRNEYGLPDVKGKILPWTKEYARSQFEVILEENPPVFCSGLGTPDWVIPEAHAQGIKVISLVGNVRSAVRMKDQGSDIIIAQGTEAGGHTGRVGTMALVPQIVDAVAPTPVIAAGGIGDGRGLVAALALGAAGVWMGTAFLVAEEAFAEAAEGIPDVAALADYTPAQIKRFQQKCIESDEEGTLISRCLTGKSCRLLKCELVDRWEKSGLPTIGMPLQGVLITNLMAGFYMTDYSSDLLNAPAGQITGMLKKVRPAWQIIAEIVEQASSILG